VYPESGRAEPQRNYHPPDGGDTRTDSPIMRPSYFAQAPGHFLLAQPFAGSGSDSDTDTDTVRGTMSE